MRFEAHENCLTIRNKKYYVLVFGKKDEKENPSHLF